MLLPAFFLSMLPPALAFLAVLFCGLLMGLAARWGFLSTVRGFRLPIIGAVLGFSFSVGQALPGSWGIVAAIVSIVLGFVCVAAWEQRLGLAPAPRKGPSAWGGDALQQTPEGEPLRVFNFGEIAMGAPVCCDYLFPDGVLLRELGSSAVFSSDGRYFAAPLPSRDIWGLLVFDRQQRRVYRRAESEFWELDTMDLNVLSGRRGREESVRRIRLDELFQTASAIDLVPVVDLWVEPSDAIEAADHFERRSADGQQCLLAKRSMPISLRELNQPLEPLFHPLYAVYVNGQPSDLLIEPEAPLIWSSNHRALLCLAREEATLSANEQYWLWQLEKGWRVLPSPWVTSASEPSSHWYEFLSLDAHHVRIASYLDYPQPESGRYGYHLSSIHSDTEIQIGHNAQGREQIANFQRTRIAFAMPLDSSGQRGASHVETQPMQNGVSACLIWMSDNSGGLGAYRCQIGDWQLPGRWLLDHRVSDCGRYLALLPFAESTTAASHAVVADAQDRRLLSGPSMWVARILDFRHGRLSLAVIEGHLDQDLSVSALQRFNVAATPINSDPSFCQPSEQYRLFYNTVDLQVSDLQLCSLAPWRLVDRPQVANADGDFILPAPEQQDAAWLFGSETEYSRSCLCAYAPRFGGCLLTASGCALVDVTPSMIWSTDGRYLALTCLKTGFTEQYERDWNWQLLLLDVQEHCLRLPAQRLGNRPVFESFDQKQLRVRSFERHWAAEDDADPGSIHAVSLNDLLQLPAEPLVYQQGFWHRPAQVHLANLWRAVRLPACEYFTRLAQTAK